MKCNNKSSITFMGQLLAYKGQVHLLYLPAIWLMLTIITPYIFREMLGKPEDLQTNARYINNEEHGGTPSLRPRTQKARPHFPAHYNKRLLASCILSHRAHTDTPKHM